MRLTGQLILFIALSATSVLAAPMDPGGLAKAIDQQLDARLAKEHLQPAPRSSDAEFLRRACLDLHGVVPTLSQTQRFLADTRPDKRATLITELLADSRYGVYMGDMWQGYLMSPLADDAKNRSARFSQWLAEQFNTRTWDQIATSLIAGTGRMEENPAVTYLIEGRLPRSVPDLTDLTSRYFLGVRLNCAQCHDHPFIKTKQEEFWGLAAFFTQIQTPKRAKQVYEKGIVDDPSLSLATLRDAGKPDGFIMASATFPGGKAAPANKTPLRATLAEWMTSPQNPYFARAMVNRTWWRLFGRGIVQPVDDIHEANLPSHPELLDLLTKQFIESGFDLKFLTRSIMLSQAYQRTSQAGADGDKQAALFGRMSVKVLTAGQLYDSLEALCGPPTKVTGIDARAGARWEFTQFFGDSGDPDPTTYRRGIPHLLRLMNSGQFAGQNLTSVVAKLTSSGKSSDEVARDLFLTILSRQPSDAEMQKVNAHLAKAESTSAGLNELAWVLLMTSEFSVNH